MTIQEKDGKICRSFTPATYCDTSFLIEFDQFPLNEIFSDNTSVEKDEFYFLLRKFWNLNQREQKIKKIIEKIYNFESATTLVYSPLVTLEYIEKKTENNLLNLAKHTYPIIKISKQGRKEIGKTLQILSKEFEQKENNYDTSLEHLALNVFHNSFQHSDDSLGFFEIVPIDVVELTLSHNDIKFESLIKLSQLQLGLADILHLIVANKVGCEYFATFDTDFIRAKTEISDIFNLKVLGSVDEMFEKM